jgi:hypothetical protein
LFQKIPFHRQLADLGMQILEATGIHLRLRRVAARWNISDAPSRSAFFHWWIIVG